MTTSLGAALRKRRQAHNLTQQAVSARLGVTRPTLAQWEGGRHLPSAEHVRRLDDIYGARGELIVLAEASRPGAEGPSTVTTGRRRTLAHVFDDVADGLLEALVTDKKGTPLGWSHDLKAGSIPTPLSTAFAIRTLQLLDDGRVDLHALGVALERRRSGAGWSNRTAVSGRPEVTALVLAALARLGLLTDVPGSLRQLEDSLDAFDRTRPYVLAVVLESVLAIRPDAPLATALVQALLGARTRWAEGDLWAADANADARRVEPSLAHTARCTTTLRLARAAGIELPLDAAIEAATSWIVARNKDDDGITEVLRPDPENPATHIPVNHFTAAWCVRALAGADGVPAPRLDAAIDTVWTNYSADDRLWVWRGDGTLPSWMTHDAVAALRARALSSAVTPIPVEHDVETDPDA